jgi:tripartite ATP-independent transporter DctM subunit
MTTFFIVTAILIVTILIGIPIDFEIGITTIIYIWMTMPQNIVVIPIKMFEAVDLFILMSLPLFILAGEIMIDTGISTKLFGFVRLFLGRIRGGLAYVNVFASTIFGSLSGAALADIAALGKVEIEAMKEEGYKKDFSCAITAASSLQSPLIPPSNTAILYSGIMGISVGAVLLAGLVPGLLLGASQIIYIAFNAKRMNLPKHEKQYSKTEIIKIVKDGCVALTMPLIILGGIMSGIVTPTEAAGLAVFYAIIISLFVYRNVSLGDFMNALWKSVKSAANLFIIISFASIFAWVMSIQNVPDQIAQAMMKISDNPATLFFIINIILVIVGMWLSTGAAIILFAPILAPIMYKVGIHPVHFAIVMILNLMIGAITPPVGVVLYATIQVGQVKFADLLKAGMPLIVMGFIVLALVTYIPDIVLCVPRLFGLL